MTITPDSQHKQKKPLRRIGGQPNSSVRMICFPWSGAGASVYRRLLPYLPKYMELFAVQLPGREDRFNESCLRRIQQVVDMVLPTVIEMTDKPLVLFGHSMGTLLVYEIAQALRRSIGKEPDLLIVSGRGAPNIDGAVAKKWHIADDDVFINYMRELGGTPEAVLNDRELMNTLLGMLKADYEMLETYTCTWTTPLTCPLVTCAGKEDRHVVHAAVEAWVNTTTGPAKIHWFAGHHFYLATNPEELMRYIDSWIIDCGLANRQSAP